MDIIGYLVIGAIAGMAAGWYIGVRTTASFVPSIVAAMVAGVVGGLLTRMLGAAEPPSFLGAAVCAVLATIAVWIVRKTRVSRER
jgi:uncharacterized membrane protein YeaQ/YmgE (transglycosylase-associated protein family)